MKRVVVVFFSTFLLFFFASALQAQNQSAENSDVIFYNSWWEFSGGVDCPETGFISFTGVVHDMTKITPSGKWSQHYNAYGEGVDDSGGVWKWHDAWNISSKDGDWHETQVWTLQGPKGAKLQMKVVYIEKDGELVIYKFDPLCE
jgi:hypothetical protein